MVFVRKVVALVDCHAVTYVFGILCCDLVLGSFCKPYCMTP